LLGSKYLNTYFTVFNYLPIECLSICAVFAKDLNIFIKYLLQHEYRQCNLVISLSHTCATLNHASEVMHPDILNGGPVTQATVNDQIEIHENTMKKLSSLYVVSG